MKRIIRFVVSIIESSKINSLEDDNTVPFWSGIIVLTFLQYKVGFIACIVDLWLAVNGDYYLFPVVLVEFIIGVFLYLAYYVVKEW